MARLKPSELMITEIPVPVETDFEAPMVMLPRKEKNRFATSFLIALGLHLAVLFGGGFVLIQPPEYGIEGSSASMYVYMVAALPDKAKQTPVRVSEMEMFSSIPEAQSDMMLPGKTGEDKRPEAARKNKEAKEKEKLVTKDANKTNVKGDGSSEVPGQSVTTLYSPGSSEIAGKAGKYQNRPPQYPAAAERNGWEGEVMLKVQVKKEGHPAQVLLEKTSGYDLLDKAAIKAVKRWKFTSGRIGNMEVASWVRIPIKFEIDKTGKKTSLEV